jgi:hypothetical protein
MEAPNPVGTSFMGPLCYLFQFCQGLSNAVERKYSKNNNNRFLKTINTAGEVSCDHDGYHDQSIQCNASRRSGITGRGRPTRSLRFFVNNWKFGA